METDRDDSADSGPDLRARQQELLRSLRAAVETLGLSVERIEALISRFDGQLNPAVEPPRSRPSTQISYGGGASVIGPQKPDSFTDARETPNRHLHATGPRGSLGFRDRPLTGARRPVKTVGNQEIPGTPALMMATELAHLGYSREEIGERLTERWGERAAAILRDALD
jgi:hypothetical protein